MAEDVTFRWKCRRETERSTMMWSHIHIWLIPQTKSPRSNHRGCSCISHQMDVCAALSGDIWTSQLRPRHERDAHAHTRTIPFLYMHWNISCVCETLPLQICANAQGCEAMCERRILAAFPMSSPGSPSGCSFHQLPVWPLPLVCAEDKHSTDIEWFQKKRLKKSTLTSYGRL